MCYVIKRRHARCLKLCCFECPDIQTPKQRRVLFTGLFLPSVRNVFLLHSHKNILDMLLRLLIINIKPHKFQKSVCGLDKQKWGKLTCYSVCVFFYTQQGDFSVSYCNIYPESHCCPLLLFYDKVLAAAVWVLTPRGHEDPLPPLPSLRPLSHRRYAEVLRPHGHWYLWHQHHCVSTFKQLYSTHSKKTSNMFFLRLKVVFPTLFWVDHVLSLAEPWSDRAVACQINSVPSWRATWEGSDTLSRAWSGRRMRSLSRKTMQPKAFYLQQL